MTGQPTNRTTGDAVLVTGASTGIGQAMVEHFAGRGVVVFAAVRDLATVEGHPLVTAVRLDVTSQDEALAAAEVVRASGARLKGLVNNAGVAVGGPLEYLDLDELRRQLEINLVGQLGVTQAFLPLLREHSAPRIVFTSSIGGRIAAPFIGPYAASKHALNGLAESLRRELLPWRFGVSVLAPATVSTPIWDKAGDQVGDISAALPDEARERYGTAIESMQRLSADARHGGLAPVEVAKAAWHAVFASRPKAEYLIGREARMMATVDAVLPTRVFDRAVLKNMGLG